MVEEGGRRAIYRVDDEEDLAAAVTPEPDRHRATGDCGSADSCSLIRNGFQDRHRAAAETMWLWPSLLHWTVRESGARTAKRLTLSRVSPGRIESGYGSSTAAIADELWIAFLHRSAAPRLGWGADGGTRTPDPSLTRR